MTEPLRKPGEIKAGEVERERPEDAHDLPDHLLVRRIVYHCQAASRAQLEAWAGEVNSRYMNITNQGL
jgi:hypothetical protein